MSYCKFSQGHPWHRPYHDREYGFPVRGEAALLERLALEINQAGPVLADDAPEARGLSAARSRGSIRTRSLGSVSARVRAAPEGRRHHPQPAQDRAVIRERAAPARRSASRTGASRSGSTRTTRDLAKEWQQALPGDLRLHGRRRSCGRSSMSTGYLRGAHEPSCPVYRRVAREEARVGEGEAVIPRSEATRDPFEAGS